MALLVVGLVRLGLGFPLWFAAYRRYGLGMCAALFLLQLAVAFALEIHKLEAKGEV
jgi:drug/metabolite transporter (DMT)-like permease